MSKGAITNEKCLEWLADKNVNPLTGRKIMTGKGVWLRLNKQCASIVIKTKTPSPIKAKRKSIKCYNDDGEICIAPKVCSSLTGKCINPNKKYKMIIYKGKKVVGTIDALNKFKASPFEKKSPSPNKKAQTHHKSLKKLGQPVVEIFEDLPIPVLPSILDKLDLKSLVNICNSSKKMKNICENKYYGGKYIDKINKYKQFMKDVKSMDKSDLNEKYGGDIDLLIIMKNENLIYYEIKGPSKYHNVLLSASKSGNIDALELIKKWSDSKKKDKLTNFDLTEALSYAAGDGHIDIMKKLIEWGATVDKFAFLYATRGDNIQAMKFINEQKNMASSYDEALYEASLDGRLKAIKLLLEWGADIGNVLKNIETHPTIYNLGARKLLASLMTNI